MECISLSADSFLVLVNIVHHALSNKGSPSYATNGENVFQSTELKPEAAIHNYVLNYSNIIIRSQYLRDCNFHLRLKRKTHSLDLDTPASKR